ncbi:hypothetical protein ACFQ60_02895 [Streptomyces zhihengii]
MVHVLSHGVVRPTGLYTLGADSVHTEWTSVRNWLSAVEDFPGRPLVLFLLDLCHSGAAARYDYQLSGLTDGHHRAWVIAASGPSELAVEGRFSRAVADVLNAVAERRIQYDHTRRHLGFHWFVDRVRDRLRELVEECGGMAHRVTADVLDTAAPDLPFFPNPCFTHGLADLPGAPYEHTTSVNVQGDDVVDPDHFLRHARGGAGLHRSPVPPVSKTAVCSPAGMRSLCVWPSGSSQGLELHGCKPSPEAQAPASRLCWGAAACGTSGLGEHGGGRAGVGGTQPDSDRASSDRPRSAAHLGRSRRLADPAGRRLWRQLGGSIGRA